MKSSKAPTPEERLGDPQRMAALRRTGLLDSQCDESFDRYTRLAAKLMRAPVALVSLLDDRRQFFKSSTGLAEPWASKRETPLSHSICQYGVADRKVLAINDTRRHPLVCKSPAIRELGAVAYLGAPLITSSNQALGMLCVIDERPRRWSARQVELLRDVASAVVSELELRVRLEDLSQAQRSARRSEERLRLLLDSTAEGIYGLDKAGDCTFCNPAALRLLGYAHPNELVGKNMHRLIHHSHADGSPYPIEQCRVYEGFLTGIGTHVDDEVLWRKDGSAFHAEYWSFPVRENDEVMGCVVTFVDISVRVKALQSLREHTRMLEESDRRKDEFLAVLGHELRNPAAAIDAGIELMRCGRTEQKTWALEMIGKQVRHLTSLLDDLLDVTRVSQGKIQLNKSVLSLESVIEAASETSKPLISERRHSFTVRVAPDASIYADGTRLEQIVSNLLANAARYTPPGGRIEVTCESSDECCTIRVKDNGIGIPHEQRQRVFEPFCQADPVGRTQGGLGIGLTLVKRLVELHDGEIILAGNETGRGCEFVVTLPRLSPPDSLGEPARVETTQTTACAKPLRILIVDDNESATSALVELLRHDGHDARSAFDGRSALACGPVFEPHVMIVDIGLPDCSGLDLASQLKDTPGCRRAKLIALSGFGDPGTRGKAAEIGFDLYLTKPVDLAALRGFVADMRT